MRLSVEARYVAGIADGKISKLVLDAEMFDVLNEVNEFCIANQIRLKCLNIEILTEEELKRKNPIPFGFLTNDLLLHDVYNKFHHKPYSNHKYCIVHFRRISKHNTTSTTFRLIYSPILKNITYSYDLYNPEYDEKPWRCENANF